MSGAWVIDSSIGFAWIHPNQATEATDRLLDEINAGSSMVVPMLWFVEIANSLLAFERRKRITAEERKTALQTLAKLNLVVDDEAGRMAFGRTSELAEKYDLTVYDATYLELALRYNVSLASRDEALNKAARKASLMTLQ